MYCQIQNYLILTYPLAEQILCLESAAQYSTEHCSLQISEEASAAPASCACCIHCTGAGVVVTVVAGVCDADVAVLVLSAP